MSGEVRSAPAAVGQVWQSWDKRQRPAGGSHLRIVQLLPNGVACERVRRDEDGRWRSYSVATVTLLLRRLTPTATGYRLIEDAPVTPPVTP